MATAYAEEIPMPPLVRDISTHSLATTCSVLDKWESDEATPATSPPSSRGESPEPKLNGVSRHARSNTITGLPAASPVKKICFVGAGFVGKCFLMSVIFKHNC